jgi:hypothetical protein
MLLFSTEPAVVVSAVVVTTLSALFFLVALKTWRHRLVVGRAAFTSGFCALWYVCYLEYNWTNNAVWGWSYVVFAGFAFIFYLLTGRGLVFRE